MKMTDHDVFTAAGITAARCFGDSLVESSIRTFRIQCAALCPAFTKTLRASDEPGVSGSMPVGDGFSDDIDRNNDGVINSTTNLTYEHQ
jgi:hypothetical protein